MSVDQKKKSSRFSEEMNRALIEGYTKHQAILKAKFSSTVSMSSKKAAWEGITMGVNAVNSGDRKTVDQVKKRWEDLTASVKKKERLARNNEIQRLKITGNGNLPDDEESNEMLPYPVAPATDSMSSPERQVADVLGPQVFLGIKGGTDTLDTSWKKAEELKFQGEQSSSSVVLNFNFEEQPAASSSNREVQQVEEDEIVEVKEGTSKRRRKKTLGDAQLEYFEVVTKYYKMKMEKMKLEMELLTKKHKEE